MFNSNNSVVKVAHDLFVTVTKALVPKIMGKNIISRSRVAITFVQNAEKFFQNANYWDFLKLLKDC